MREQVPTSLTTIEAIMNTREFALGVIDGRAGRGYRRAYATWDIDRQWNYERGRAWAALAPRSMALKHASTLTDCIWVAPTTCARSARAISRRSLGRGGRTVVRRFAAPGPGYDLRGRSEDLVAIPRLSRRGELAVASKSLLLFA